MHNWSVRRVKMLLITIVPKNCIQHDRAQPSVSPMFTALRTVCIVQNKQVPRLSLGILFHFPVLGYLLLVTSTTF